MNNEILDDCKQFADRHRGKNKQSGAHWSTIIRFAPLYDEAVRLQKRVAELEAVNEDQALTISQNDYAYAIDKEMMEAEIKESNDLLRSAFMIAKRDGKDTNWEAWHNQLSVALARQHAIIYGKDEK